MSGWEVWFMSQIQLCNLGEFWKYLVPIYKLRLCPEFVTTITISNLRYVASSWILLGVNQNVWRQNSSSFTHVFKSIKNYFLLFCMSRNTIDIIRMYRNKQYYLTVIDLKWVHDPRNNPPGAEAQDWLDQGSLMHIRSIISLLYTWVMPLLCPR